MKKFILASLFLGALAAWKLRASEAPISNSFPAALQERVAPKEYKPELAKQGAEQAAAVAAEEVSLPELPRLGRQELEGKISEIDSYLESHQFVDRANKGILSQKELAEFRRLLGLRNKYFDQKIDFVLNES